MGFFSWMCNFQREICQKSVATPANTPTPMMPLDEEYKVYISCKQYYLKKGKFEKHFKDI